MMYLPDDKLGVCWSIFDSTLLVELDVLFSLFAEYCGIAKLLDLLLLLLGVLTSACFMLFNAVFCSCWVLFWFEIEDVDDDEAPLLLNSLGICFDWYNNLLSIIFLLAFVFDLVVELLFNDLSFLLLFDLVLLDWFFLFELVQPFLIQVLFLIGILMLSDLVIVENKKIWNNIIYN